MSNKQLDAEASSGPAPSSTASGGAVDILYYDGQCPLCVKEMDRLRTLKRDTLVLRDIHTLTTPDPQPNPTPQANGLLGDGERPDKDTLLRVLHLERNGEYLTGIDANVAAWEHTRFGLLWRWLRWPLIRPVVEHVYGRWAQWRYDRLYKQQN